MSKKVIIVSAFALMFSAGLAQAEVAKVVSMDGSAVIERGSYRYDAKVGMFLEEGDVVRSLQGNIALKYSDCISKIEANQEVKVMESAPCATAKASTVANTASTGVASVATAGVSLVPVLAGAAGAAAAVSTSGTSSKTVAATGNDAVSP